jgi:hypothetical protein
MKECEKDIVKRKNKKVGKRSKQRTNQRKCWKTQKSENTQKHVASE